MTIDQNILKFDEKVVFTLRSLYASYGYRQFKMSKFEEYDLYSKNKDFLVSDGIITFNDTNGKLLALKPDVTLSIIKNARGEKSETEKFYYNENVYRISGPSQSYKEIMQTGLECIGDIGDRELWEVTQLAAKSLGYISEDFILRLSHVGLLDALLSEYGVSDASKADVRAAISQKNACQLQNLLSQDTFQALACLIESFPSAAESLAQLKRISKTDASAAATNQLGGICTSLIAAGYGEKIAIDFSISNNTGYYSGIIFKGFLGGIASHVLSGGQYDALMRRMSRSCGAVGFAVYLDALERMSETKSADGFINIALPKGRLGEKVYAMFEKAGYDCPSIKEENRKLIFENPEKGIRYFWVKPSDVAIYVERGAADIGVAGKDILLEYTPDVYELLDLGVGKCRMAVAAKKNFSDDVSKTLRVATKFSNIAKSYYAGKCRDIDIIHLNGSIEIAPILGLSDVIVDIVETGKTLLENDLAPFETICPISARLISNKASYGFKTQKIEEIKQSLMGEVNA